MSLNGLNVKNVFISSQFLRKLCNFQSGDILGEKNMFSDTFHLHVSVLLTRELRKVGLGKFQISVAM